MKRLILSILSFFLLFQINSIFACSCSEIPTLEGLYNGSSSIFIGKVTNIEFSNNIHSIVTFDVLDLYKGFSGKTIKISNGNGTSCGITFTKDKIYLVYTYKTDDGNEFVSICGRTREIDYKDKDNILDVKYLEYKNDPSIIVRPPETCFGFDKITKTITSYDISCGLDVVIPSKIGGINVKKIGDRSFEFYNIKSLVIPEGVIEIGNRSFQGNQLTFLVIPNSVTNIGAYAFESNDITDVLVGKSLQVVGYDSFGGINSNKVKLKCNGYKVNPSIFEVANVVLDESCKTGEISETFSSEGSNSNLLEEYDLREKLNLLFENQVIFGNYYTHANFILRKIFDKIF